VLLSDDKINNAFLDFPPIFADKKEKVNFGISFVFGIDSIPGAPHTSVSQQKKAKTIFVSGRRTIPCQSNN